MSTMHADEVHTDAALVRRLIGAQFPQWAALPVVPVRSAGTDNAIYRLGEDMAVRLPRIHWAVEQVAKEQHWLPRLAPQLPLPIPLPLAQGQPAFGYPWRWSVYGWLPGEHITVADLTNPDQLAADLARFIAALQRIDPAGGPPPGPHNGWRGAPLVSRDTPTRAAIASLGGELDTHAVTAAWETALRTPAWEQPPVWIHGDLSGGNLLTAQGQLSAVIDFGCLGVGDPACDLIVAWSLLPASARAVLRQALGVDDPTWARGRGWALSVALIALPYYRTSNPILVASARHTIAQILADQQR